MGGCGSGGAYIAQAMRRQTRRDEARRESRRARRQARMDGIRAQRALQVQDESLRWGFPCAFACGQCGHLATPESLGFTDPMRREFGTTARPGPCTRCGHPAAGAIDLADRGMARALVDLEVHDHEQTPNRPALVVRHLLGGLAGAALAATALVLGLAPIVTVAGLALAGGQWTVAARRWRQLRSRRRLPRRWRMHPEPAQTRVLASRATADGEPIAAPLTGRPCLAFEVVVAWSGTSPTEASTVALAEQRLGNVTVDGSALGPRTHLRLRHRRVENSAVLESPAAIQYLASRGLEPTDGSFDYYESIVEPGDAVTVLGNEDHERVLVAA